MPISLNQGSKEEIFNIHLLLLTNVIKTFELFVFPPNAVLFLLRFRSFA
jgi:hypothetical protein